MKEFGLVRRAALFSIRVREHLSAYKYNALLIDDFRQLIRSSGAIGDNYIEANQHLGTKDFKMRIKIAKKEAAEAAYWAEILSEITKDEIFKTFQSEARELELILGSIQKSFS